MNTEIPESINWVSKSARMAAAVRAIEAQRPDPLFKDPLASRLAGEDIIAEVTPSTQEYEDRGTPLIAVRTRFFDDFLISLNNQVRQVVILGAGMDARAFRLPFHPDTCVYEVDAKEVLQYKESILEDTPSNCHRYTLETDLRKSWSNLLIEKGFQVETPSVWLMEGFIYYLSDTEVHELLKTITKLSASMSWLACDLIGSFFLSQNSGELSKHWKYGCDEPEKLFSLHDWEASVVQAGDDGASYGRFTYKFLPRDVPNVPRYFFVTAVLKK
ncbi:SAM-dependent methyltransferase [Aetokthonos hydrillicola Thurmond2011]|uniref:S-adenosyl-L-methionine-dependent methyltransferase n=1 Tax=Aetokthonos hydrillicola Thurmond2011 TaxID=2712845 RepID=A0AAP5I578_9CYAN|nr:SAM-dependent methyltransferase [Aetokthonos hydrillicola]MBO3462782.1 SAM-dependent methyltransferase [Aetokthonos hydrillicola CCALA 1050]MBW4590178.1 SAM-dependent methyltransferase [Aetokthonos hydrillicola CCALA 1050]MDR9893323.1 SAM-dependent methyltransferase [Aetokthonos hydrillicola Thurmond2011]